MIGAAIEVFGWFLGGCRDPHAERREYYERLAEAHKQRAYREYQAPHQYGEFTEIKPLPAPTLALPPPKA